MNSKTFFKKSILVAGEIDFANLDSITDLGADDFLTMGGNSAGATPASSIDVATATLDITTGGNATLLAAIQAGITAETGAAKAGYLFTVTNSDSSLAGSAGTYAVFNVASDNTFDSATDFIVKLTGTSALTIAAQFDVA